MPPTLGNGKICYIEIAAVDVKRETHSSPVEQGYHATIADELEVFGGQPVCAGGFQRRHVPLLEIHLS